MECLRAAAWLQFEQSLRMEIRSVAGILAVEGGTGSYCV